MDRLSALLKFYEEDPGDAFTLFAIASEYSKSGDSESALRFFTILTEEHPDYVGTYYHLGKLYETLGRKQSAADTYRTGIEVSHQQRDAHARAELQSALLALDE